MEAQKEKAALVERVARLENERETDRALIKSQRLWIETLQRRIDGQQTLMSNQSLTLAERHEEVIRLELRFSYLESDMPSSSNIARSLRSELETEVDIFLQENERLESHIALSESAQGSSRNVGTLITENA